MTCNYLYRDNFHGNNLITVTNNSNFAKSHERVDLSTNAQRRICCNELIEHKHEVKGPVHRNVALEICCTPNIDFRVLRDLNYSCNLFSNYSIAKCTQKDYTKV